MNAGGADVTVAGVVGVTVPVGAMVGVPVAVGATTEGNVADGAMEAFTEVVLGTSLVAALSSLGGVGTLYVTGHSLGGAMVQDFLTESFSGPSAGYTWGSPGAGISPTGQQMVNFEHVNDPVPSTGKFFSGAYPRRRGNHSR